MDGYCKHLLKLVLEISKDHGYDTYGGEMYRIMDVSFWLRIMLVDIRSVAFAL